MSIPETFRSLTFASALRAAAARDPGKVAIIEGSRTTTFGRLADRVGRLRDAAIGLGVAQGEVAAIISRNRTEFIEVVAGMPDAHEVTRLVLRQERRGVSHNGSLHLRRLANADSANGETVERKA